MARPTKATAIARLQKALDVIPELKQLKSDSSEFRKWHGKTQEAITGIFEDNTDKIQDFEKIVYSSPRELARQREAHEVPIGVPEMQPAPDRAWDAVAAQLDRQISDLATSEVSQFSGTQKLAFLERKAADLREKFRTAAREDRPRLAGQLIQVLAQQANLNVYQEADPRQHKLFNDVLIELEDLRDVVGREADEHERQQNESYKRGLNTTTVILESMIDEIEEYWEDEHQTSPSPAAQENERTNTKEVFVIHGRDNEAKETVARFLTRLDLTPVILHEKPNQGRTIIEKFEQHAQVGFAVALLTPDDVGALKNEEKNLKPRARQNVVFELGYFLGRLGRERVCALTKGNIEIPSDYDGVAYIPLDDFGGWKMKLIEELKNVGFDVDANKAL